MKKRWASSLLSKWQDERKTQRGAILPYRYLWSWKRCHCIYLMDIFSINLSHQFLKMCKYLATIMSYTEKSCPFILFSCVNCFAHFEAATAISVSELPVPLVLFVLFCIKKEDAEWTLTPFLRPLRTLQTSATSQLSHFLEWWSLIYLLILCKEIFPLPW